jgi:hypothetical protein
MSYIGKSVKFQHRVATGFAKNISGPKGERIFVPTPTELRIDDALVLSEHAVEGEKEPRLFLVYQPSSEALIGADWMHALVAIPDVPHQNHDAAEGEQFWFSQSDADAAHIAALRADLKNTKAKLTEGTKK